MILVPRLRARRSTKPRVQGGQRLDAFLCWAVVFADIGTSVYYVPGILYNQEGIGKLAGLFVTLTLAVFLLLIIKYAEVSVRFPEGGGVVSVAARGLHPWAGAVGGMLILTSHFLTSAISARSGVEYLKGLLPSIEPFVLAATLLLMALLGLLNRWGIKESATVSAFFAVAALVSDLLILGLIIIQVRRMSSARCLRACSPARASARILSWSASRVLSWPSRAWSLSHNSRR